MKYYDASTEHKPFERSTIAPTRHPNKGQKGKHPMTGKEAKVLSFRGCTVTAVLDHLTA